MAGCRSTLSMSKIKVRISNLHDLACNIDFFIQIDYLGSKYKYRSSGTTSNFKLQALWRKMVASNNVSNNSGKSTKGFWTEKNLSHWQKISTFWKQLDDRKVIKTVIFKHLISYQIETPDSNIPISCIQMQFIFKLTS